MTQCAGNFPVIKMECPIVPGIVFEKNNVIKLAPNISTQVLDKTYRYWVSTQGWKVAV